MTGQQGHGASMGAAAFMLLARRLKLKARIALWELMPSRRGSRRLGQMILRARNFGWPEASRRFEARLATLGPDSLCLDCGANVGVFTERLAATGARVHAFEPDPYAFSRLSERVGAAPNVTLHHAAIGLEDGALTLTRDARFDEDPARFSIGTGAFASTYNAPGGERFEVPLVGFRSFIERLGVPVDLVKMDIEGCEVDILEDMLATPFAAEIGEMFVETHEAQIPVLRKRTRSLRRRVARRGLRDRICLDWQ